MPHAKTRVAVLISGTGSNMASLIAAGQAPDSPYEVVVVVSNIAEAGGLAKAQAAGVEALTVEHRSFGKDREAHERALDALLRERGVEVVALAGYMRLLTPWLVGRWAGRMLNIHPSLLPLYPGLNTHARAIEAGKGPIIEALRQSGPLDVAIAGLDRRLTEFVGPAGLTDDAALVALAIDPARS